MPRIGAEEDVIRFKRFLTSKIGGAWNDDGQEIEAFINPTNQQLVAPMMDAADADYSFILFSGHGNHPPNRMDPLFTILALADGELRARDLDPRNGKALIIVDACRRFARLPAPILTFLAENTRIAAREPSRKAYRDFFDHAVNTCPQQVTYLFACSLDQFAYGNRTHGGLYCRTLISTAIEWERAQQSQGTYLTVANGHHRTRQRVLQTGTPTQQTPDMRRYNSTGRHLPICIQL